MPFDSLPDKKSFAGMNFAPVEPLRRLKYYKSKDVNDTSNLASIFREILNHLKNENWQQRNEIAETGRLMAGLRSGKQIVQRNPLDGQFALLPALPQKPKRGMSVVPLAQVKSSELTSTWDLSRPKVVSLLFGNTVRSQIQHAITDQIIQHNDDYHFDVPFNQRESLSMMDYGVSIIRPFYDDRINTLRQIQPIIENEQQTIFEGYGFCPTCGYEDAPTKFKMEAFAPQCTECGSFNAAVIPAQVGEVTKIVGHQEIVQGDLGVSLLDVTAANWDMRFMVQDSSWFDYATEIPVRLAESYLGIEIQESDGDDYFLNAVREISNRGGGAEGLGRERIYNSAALQTRTAVFRETWLKPEWYAGQKLSKSEKTVSGETIPANQDIAKFFPNGVCVISMNDAEIIPGIFGEKCRVVSAPYHIQSHSGVGKGTSDVIELSEQLNIAHTAAMEDLKRVGAGGGFAYDKDAITQAEAKHLLKPDGLVGVSLKNNTHLGRIGDAVQRVRTDANLQANMVMVAQLTNFINIAFQATDFTNGTAANTVNVDTLGGQQLLAAQNQMRASAPLRMKGYLRAKAHEQLLELFRENIKIPKFFGTSDKFALTKGKYISGDDLPENIKCRFVLDSEHPNDKFTQRENVVKMAQESANFSGLPFSEFARVNPRMAAWFADRFDADLPQFNYGEILMVCQERLDQLKEIVAENEQIFAMSEFYPPEEEAGTAFVDALAKKVEMDEENHAIKAEVLGAYLDDDEVSEWSNYLRLGVRALINRHYEMQSEKELRPAMLAQNAQMKLQEKQMRFQQAMSAPQTAQETQQDLLTEGLSRAVDAGQKEDEFNRQQEAASLDHQRKLELEEIKYAGRK